MKIKKYIITAYLISTLLIPATSPAWQGMGGGHGGQMPAGHGNSAAALNEMGRMGHQESRNEVVALVNGHEITMGRLMDSMQEIIMAKYGRREINSELARRIRGECLEKLAMEELAYRHAIQIGIKPDMKLIAGKLAAVKKAAGGAESFQQQLRQKNKSEEDIEREITYFTVIKEVIEREINQKIAVSPEKIDKTYQANRDQFVSPERVVVTDVIFFLDPAQPESLAKVKKIREKIINEYDNKPMGLTPVGFVVTPDLDVSPDYKPEHYKAAKAMEKGEISQPLIIDETLHLLKFDNYQARSEKPAAEARKMVANKLKAMRREQLLAQWRQELRKDADIRIVHEMFKDN